MFQIHGGALPVLPIVDPVERDIDFMPSKAPYNPRHMLAGKLTTGRDNVAHLISDGNSTLKSSCQSDTSYAPGR